MWNKNWWGLLDIGCWGLQVQVQKGQQNKNVEQKLTELKLVEQKFSGDSQSLGGEDPLVQVQKGQWNKNTEQNCGTKMLNKNWWGLLDIGC